MLLTLRVENSCLEAPSTTSMRNLQRMASWLLQCSGYSDKILEACKCINALFIRDVNQCFSNLLQRFFQAFSWTVFMYQRKLKIPSPNIWGIFQRQIFPEYSGNIPKIYHEPSSNSPEHYKDNDYVWVRNDPFGTGVYQIKEMTVCRKILCTC